MADGGRIVPTVRNHSSGDSAWFIGPPEREADGNWFAPVFDIADGGWPVLVPGGVEIPIVYTVFAL